MTERKDVPGLDAYFEAARSEPPLPDGDWLDRMEALAIAAAPTPPARSARNRGLLAGLGGLLGGWPGLAGLVAASAAGLWLGVTGTLATDALWPNDAALLVLDPVSAYDIAWAEE